VTEESSNNTNRKSTTRFSMGQDEHRRLLLSPPRGGGSSAPKGGSKTQNGRYPSNIALRLRKVCYKVYLCENGQRQSCKAFICLHIRAKMVGVDFPFYVRIWRILIHPLVTRQFSIYFCS